MTNQFNPRLISLLKFAAQAGSILVILVGCSVLVGWALDIMVLKSILPKLVTMKANTALAFVLTGVSLWLARAKRADRGMHRVSQVCAFTAALVGLLTLSEYLFGWDLGIDQLLFREMPGAVATPYLGRMAPTTAVNFFLLGLALLLPDVETRRGFRPAQFLALLAIFISFLALVGYAYGITSFYGIAAYTAMAVHTAAAFIVLSAGILFAQPERGFMAVVVSDTAGGIMARQLLPAIVVIPFLLGWLMMAGQHAGFYGLEFGVSLFVLSNIVLFAGLIWRNAGLLYHMDTERKKAEERIRKLNESLMHQTAELEVANKELEAFAYSASHDLRAPLRSIDGFSLALLEDYDDKLDQQGKDYLQRVRAGVQRMGQLIDDLLRLSRVTRAEMHRERVNLTALAQEIATALRQSQPEREAEFVIAQGVVAHGDVQLLRILLENLLGNSWKFTSKHLRAKIEFGVMQKEEETVYFVRDDGVGFDMAYADKLFAPFQRLHAEEFPGTGIGLAIVERIIRRHGGRIWAEGAVERGATFYFTLWR